MEKRDQYFTAKCVAGGITLNTRKTLINSKLRDMASKAPPPLIRSTKAFSVEIPEGSNSAKSRRSDVVPNDEIDLHASAAHFHGAELDMSKPLGMQEDGSGLHGGGFSEDQHNANNVQSIDDHGLDPHLAQLPSDAHGPSTAGPNVDKGAVKDRFAGGQAGHLSTNKGVAQAGTAFRDNLQGVAQDSLKDNLQGIAQDALHDNLQGVGQDGLDDHHQGVPKDNLADNHAGIGKEAIQDNNAGIGKDAIEHNKAGIGKDAIVDNKAGIGKDAIVDNKAGIGKSHVEDHIVALPPTDGMNLGPSGKAPSSHAAATEGHQSADPSSPVKSAKSISQRKRQTAEEKAIEAKALLQDKLEKEKKLEEFHGRVDAIRKTVSGINHKLDELDDEEPSK